MCEENLARRKERHAPRRALEERRAQLVLEAADVPAEGRLCDPQLARGASHVPFFRDGDEVPNLGEAHPTCKGASASASRQWATRGTAAEDRRP